MPVSELRAPKAGIADPSTGRVDILISTSPRDCFETLCPMKTQSLHTPAPLVLSVVACFALCPMAKAVNPPPDGGYSGFNTAEGQNALFNLTTGVGNVAVGWFSLWSNTDGSFNTGVGAGTLLFNIGDQAAFEGIQNTAIGAAALLFNSTGSANTAVGTAALLNNTTGTNNTAIGAQALYSNTTGNLNTANGLGALLSNTTGIGNTAEGGDALVLNTTGGGNTAIGEGALSSNTIGNANIALGAFAGHDLTTGDRNIIIGNPSAVAGESNTMRIGGNSQTRAFITGIRGVATGNADAIAVLIDSAGQLGTLSSSRRFKKEIKPMDKASEAILGLKPVTFHYKSDGKATPQFGLIAEEVAEANPDLVVRNEKGEIYTVRYEAVNAMLLNEFLKQHARVEEQDRKIQKQEATITQLKNDVEALVARLKEGDSKIQRVTAQLD
jgi:Chaperone of endosialidase